MKATDLRKGHIIRFNQKLVRVLEAKHHTPGNLRAMVQVEMKDLEKGNKLDHRFRSSDEIEKIHVDHIEMQYLYKEGNNYVFMNNETYEQAHLSEDLLDGLMGYVVPNTNIKVSFVDDRPISVEIPQKVTLTVTETEPGIKNATATNVLKPATTDTGLVIKVPPFINVGEQVIINTETGDFVSRA